MENVGPVNNRKKKIKKKKRWNKDFYISPTSHIDRETKWFVHQWLFSETGCKCKSFFISLREAIFSLIQLLKNIPNLISVLE